MDHSNMTMFFEGTVPEAIQASRRELKPLLVLLTGFDQGSRQVQDALIEQAAEEYAAGSIVLALEDDLSNSDASQFSDAKNFRAFCPVEQLPTVVMVSPVGAQVLAKVAGVVPAGELKRQLATAYQLFKQNQARLLAAQAALAAMTAAAAAGGEPGGSTGAAGVQGAAASAEATSSMDADPTAPIAAADAAAAEPAAAGAAMAADADAAAEEVRTQAAAPLPAAAAASCSKQAEAGAAAGAAAASEEQADAAAQPYMLQFKFTDGTVLRGQFGGTAHLAEVFGWLDEQRAAAGACKGLAYVLVQAAPRVVIGAAQEAQRLAESGIQPRTSLQVIPHAAQGHRPPPPPPQEPEPVAVEAARAAGEAATAETAAAASGQQQQEEGSNKAESLAQQLQAVRAQAAAAAAQLAAAAEAATAQKRKARAAAAVQEAPQAAVPQAPAQIQLQVRLSSGEVLRRAFQPGARLAEVLDWVDAERTDRGAYKLVQPFPKRAFFSGDLSKTLAELGFDARTSLQLEPLPPKTSRSTAQPAAGATAASSAQAAQAAAAAKAKVAAAAAAKAAQVEAAKLPDTFTLQFKLTNGEQLRGSFPPDATLQEVCHYLDTHRTDEGVPYQLVQPYPKRRFTTADLAQPLLALGLQQRQLLLLEPLPGAAPPQSGGGWGLRGLVATAASYLNPWSYFGGGSGPAGTPGGHAATAAAGAEEAHPAGPAAAAAATEAGQLLGVPGSQPQQQPGGGARKRAKGGAASAATAGGSNIHTLSSTGAGEGAGEDGQDPGANSYWNGNSTEFGGAPPPPQQ